VAGHTALAADIEVGRMPFDHTEVAVGTGAAVGRRRVQVGHTVIAGYNLVDYTASDMAALVPDMVQSARNLFVPLGQEQELRMLLCLLQVGYHN